MVAYEPWQERVWKYISPEPNSGCWLWDGNWNGSGYGTVNGELVKLDETLVSP